MEKLCEKAALNTPINVGVLRIGQIVGDTEKSVLSFSNVFDNSTDCFAAAFGTKRRHGL